MLRDNLIFEGIASKPCRTASRLSTSAHVGARSVVLDLTLPDFDSPIVPGAPAPGKVPIIILSARGQKADKLKGSARADDYI